MNQQQQTAARLRRVLDENEWSAAELARRLKVSQPTVHAWLHGTHGLRAHNARRVARALGISPAWLIFGADRNAEATAQTGDELALLRSWIQNERTHLVAVLGMGGIGKTSLAAKLARDAADGFERVYWRGLRDAPPVSEWLAGAIGFLSDWQLIPPPADSQRMLDLIDSLPETIGVLIIEHDMKLVFRFAQRISVLVQGRLLTEGTPAEIAEDQRVRDVYLGHRPHA